MAQSDQPGREGGFVSRSVDEFVNQLRGFTERLQALPSAVPGRPSLPSLPSPPGAMSAAQLKAIAGAIRAQRTSMAAMRAQLEAFDDQMAVFERILDPLVEWSTTWARLEQAVSDVVRRDGSGKQP